VVDALRIRMEMSVQTLEGVIRGNIGDWLVTGEHGEQELLRDNIFCRAYEPVDEEAEELMLEAKKNDKSMELDQD